MNKIGEYMEFPDPITGRTKRLAMVLGREMTGRILAKLYMSPFQSASDIAKQFNIHIATAQKYLVEMRECGILESRWRRNTNRPSEEYWLAKKRFDIEIDLEQMPKQTELEKKAADIYIKQRISEKVAFDTDRRLERITQIILTGGKANGRIEKRIELNEIEGRFAWHLPLPNEKPESILALMRKAKLDSTDLPRVIALVDKLTEIDIGSTNGLKGIIERTGVITDE